MINGIVAVDKGQGIGINNRLPWPRLNGDMQWFKEKTLNNIVIMGSKTWQSILKPLSQRINVVITRHNNVSSDHKFSNADHALIFCKEYYPNKEIFIIGGESIYNHYLKVIDRFYVTEIDSKFDCDRFFNLDWIKKNRTTVIEHASFNEPIKYKIKEYRL